MRISDLKERLAVSFGEQWAPSFSQDIAISELGSKTVNEALAAGLEVDEIWRAVCKQCPTETAKQR
ncbi:unannotated protein [freshwater metagenome]|uniref:Unannotated protein n=1 Tax=freshwater metagenome TaxID=449393 RepID=A0A6J5YY25_9ZZZZ|nr:DUF3046 domain-containing protein [Actinomycetota bacterium]